MKKFLSTALIAIVSLSAGQALALIPENTTKHKIETNYVEEKIEGIDEIMKGYVLTIDGKPVIAGEVYTVMTQLKEPLSMILEVANAPLLPATTSRAEFSISNICPGSGVGEVIEALVTNEGETDIVCFETEEDGKLYAMFPYGGF